MSDNPTKQADPMKQAERTLALVGQAQARVNRALRHWQSASFSRIDECQETLLSAVSDLREVRAILKIPSAARVRSIQRLTPPIHAALVCMKQDIARLEKVVDASSSFLRALSGVTGPASPGYGADGQVVRDLARTSNQMAEG
jgi:hypothetical protein